MSRSSTASIAKLLLSIHAVRTKRAVQGIERKELTKSVHLKQVKRLEDAIEDTLEEFFLKQIYTTVSRLKKTEEKSLAQNAFNSQEWTDELVNRLFPVFAQGMIEAANAQLKILDASGLKASTATEYLEGLEDLDLGGFEFVVPIGVEGTTTTVMLNIATEFPQYMLDAIDELLGELFEQDFWRDISQTTLDDIEALVTQGLQEGWSIRKIATELATSLGGDSEYALIRAKRIARTESGHILNGARVRAIDQFLEETGLHDSVKKVWLSVLGNTTRETHANLDGVPADREGKWFLGGVHVRWPSDIVLPPGERINCFPGKTLVSGSFRGSQRAWYEGIVTKIITRNGTVLTVTPNHPVMTSQGFVPASELKPRNKLVSYDLERDNSFVSDFITDQVENKPPRIEDVFQTILAGHREISDAVKIKRTEMNDFYGDGKFLQGDIDVVRADWKLLKDRDIHCIDIVGDQVFLFEDSTLIFESSSSSSNLAFNGIGVSSSSFPCLAKPFSGVFIGRISPTGALSVGITSDFDAHFLELSLEHAATVSGLLRKSLEGDSRLVLFHKFGEHGFRNFDRLCHDEVASIRFESYQGYVYDLESETGMILASDNDICKGIFTSNCQCTISTEFGMQNDEADELLREYEQRRIEFENQQ